MGSGAAVIPAKFAAHYRSLGRGKTLGTGGASSPSRPADQRRAIELSAAPDDRDRP